jgi:hypothetical protein
MGIQRHGPRFQQRPSYLVGRNCSGEECIAAGLAAGDLAHGLGLRVGLHIFCERQLGHLILAEAVDIAAVEAGGRGGGHDHFGHTVLPAALNHIQGALVVDASVQLLRVKGPHGGRDVKHAVHALARRCDCLCVAQIAHNVFNVGMIPRLGRPVKREKRGCMFSTGEKTISPRRSGG